MPVIQVQFVSFMQTEYTFTPEIRFICNQYLFEKVCFICLLVQKKSLHKLLQKSLILSLQTLCTLKVIRMNTTISQYTAYCSIVSNPISGAATRVFTMMLRRIASFLNSQAYLPWGTAIYSGRCELNKYILDNRVYRFVNILAP